VLYYFLKGKDLGRKKMALVEGTDQYFATDVEGDNSGTVLVYFWAPWCPPCKVLGPIVKEVAEKIGDKVKIVKINVDDNPESTSKYEVMSIPTLITFENGKMKAKSIGIQPKEQLLKSLENFI
jgi:thioredoxin 1